MFFISILTPENISRISRYAPELAEILTETAAIASSGFSPGKKEIAGGKAVVSAEEVNLTPVGEKPLEFHKKFIDIHVPLSGEEVIGWKPVNDIAAVSEDYDDEKDVAFSSDAPLEYIKVKPGEFVIFHPSDAHSPCQGEGNHRKLCVKIPV